MLSPHYVAIISCYHTFNYASGWSGVGTIRQPLMGVVITSGTTVTLGDGVE